MDLEVTPDLTIPAADLQWRFSRSSGPGGQHVNTSDTRVQLTWKITDSAALLERFPAGTITVTVSEQRSQLRNREVALEKLATLLREALASPPPPRRPTKPTRGSARRHLVSKQQRSTTKRQRQRPVDE
jgi:ribosome-associated protein